LNTNLQVRKYSIYGYVIRNFRSRYCFPCPLMSATSGKETRKDWQSQNPFARVARACSSVIRDQFHAQKLEVTLRAMLAPARFSELRSKFSQAMGGSTTSRPFPECMATGTADKMKGNITYRNRCSPGEVAYWIAGSSRKQASTVTGDAEGSSCQSPGQMHNSFACQKLLRGTMHIIGCRNT
jgi:hypothetical protein